MHDEIDELAKRIEELELEDESYDEEEENEEESDQDLGSELGDTLDVNDVQGVNREIREH